MIGSLCFTFFVFSLELLGFSDSSQKVLINLRMPINGAFHWQFFKRFLSGRLWLLNFKTWLSIKISSFHWHRNSLGISFDSCEIVNLSFRRQFTWNSKEKRTSLITISLKLIVKEIIVHKVKLLFLFHCLFLFFHFQSIINHFGQVTRKDFTLFEIFVHQTFYLRKRNVK